MRLVPHLFFTNEVVPAPFRARLLHSVMSTSRQLINVLGTIGTFNGAPSEHTLELNTHPLPSRWAAFVFGSGAGLLALLASAWRRKARAEAPRIVCSGLPGRADDRDGLLVRPCQAPLTPTRCAGHAALSGQGLPADCLTHGLGGQGRMYTRTH